MDIVIVNPTFMIGAFDAKPTSGRIVKFGMNKKIVFCPPGGKNFVCVEDVAIGISKALIKGVNGESYLLANKNMNYYEFFDLLRKQTKKNFTIIKIPEVFLLISGYVGNCFKWMGLKTNFSLANMKALCLKCYYSNSKAKKDLKVSFSPIEKGVNEAVDWFNRKS